MGGEEGKEAAQVVAVCCGSSHSVVLLEDGTVVSFGRGEDGALGHGGSQQVMEPTAVAALLGTRVVEVHCGAEFTLANSNEDVMYSWGWGDFGRLGHANTDDLFVPKPISFFHKVKVKEVGCGDAHTLVVTTGGALFSFGRNGNGQLALGHTLDQTSPQRVLSLEGQEVASVAGGAEHSLVALSNGQVYAAGWGRCGNLGYGGVEDRHSPTRVVGLDDVRVAKVTCGWRHSVLVSDAGQLYAFGWNKYGQLGVGNNTDCPTPVPVEAMRGKRVEAVAGGWRHTMATDKEGVLYAWGWNKFGMLGLGDTEDRNAPTVVRALLGKPVKLLACGWRHAIAGTADGHVYTWGRGATGQLGHGDEQDRHEPKLLAALSKGVGLDRAALVDRAAADPAGASVPLAAASDRFAVVPGGACEAAGAEDAAVPVVPELLPGQGVAKKARLSSGGGHPG